MLFACMYTRTIRMFATSSLLSRPKKREETLDSAIAVRGSVRETSFSASDAQSS